jgi:hypothetical protein
VEQNERSWEYPAHKGATNNNNNNNNNNKIIIIIITKNLWKNLEAIPGKHSIYSLQKTAILGTSRIIWKVLQHET